MQSVTFSIFINLTRESVIICSNVNINGIIEPHHVPWELIFNVIVSTLAIFTRQNTFKDFISKCRGVISSLANIRWSILKFF